MLLQGGSSGSEASPSACAASESPDAGNPNSCADNQHAAAGSAGPFTAVVKPVVAAATPASLLEVPETPAAQLVISKPCGNVASTATAGLASSAGAGTPQEESAGVDSCDGTVRKAIQMPAPTPGRCAPCCYPLRYWTS